MRGIPIAVVSAARFSVTKTGDELSIDFVIASGRHEGGSIALQVAGPLDFVPVGILAGIASVLAAVGISVFATWTLFL